MSDSICLAPLPRRLERLSGELPLRPELAFLKHSSWAWGEKPPPDPATGLRVAIGAGAPPHGPEAYRLSISPQTIQIDAASRTALLHAARTLSQLCLAQFMAQTSAAARPTALPCLLIEDWPDFPVRGVMLDISRDKVPTTGFLYALIDHLSGLKINQLQLYTEHTFAYAPWPEVWAEASPLTPAELRELDQFCQLRHIELVPNQNSFGHMERWLKHPRLTALAETPESVRAHYAQTPFDKSFSLCPLDAGSIELLRGLYAELLPNFTSGMFNIGCDETFELGQGRSKSECERRGKGRVYLDFLLKIHQLVARHGKTMQFWGDIILQHPELLPELPRDLLALEWGYEADHPFAEDTRKFAAAGIPFYVCPGTSSWNSLGGRTANMLANLESAARHGLANGARGCVLTDWGDNGHWQQPFVSLPGFVYGAAVSWCLVSNHGLDLGRALGTHCFADPTGRLGAAVLDLGNLYQWLPEPANVNGTHICRALYQAHEPLREEMIFIPQHLDGALDALDRLRHQFSSAGISVSLSNETQGLTHSQFALTIGLMRHGLELLRARAAHGPGSTVAQVAPAERHRLADELRGLLGEHRRLWLQCNRPGGLRESAGRLERVLAQYVG